MAVFKNESVEQLVFRLRNDEAFDSAITEAIRRSPALSTRVINYDLDSEVLREFAFRIADATLHRLIATDASLTDGRYSDLIDRVVAERGIDDTAHREQREMLRSVFRYVHRHLKVRLSNSNAAWMHLGLHAMDYANAFYDGGISAVMQALGEKP